MNDQEDTLPHKDNSMIDEDSTLLCIDEIETPKKPSNNNNNKRKRKNDNDFNEKDDFIDDGDEDSFINDSKKLKKTARNQKYDKSDKSNNSTHKSPSKGQSTLDSFATQNKQSKIDEKRVFDEDESHFKKLRINFFSIKKQMKFFANQVYDDSNYLIPDFSVDSSSQIDPTPFSSTFNSSNNSNPFKFEKIEDVKVVGKKKKNFHFYHLLFLFLLI